MELDPRTLRSCPEPKVDTQPLSHPGAPHFSRFIHEERITTWWQVWTPVLWLPCVYTRSSLTTKQGTHRTAASFPAIAPSSGPQPFQMCCLALNVILRARGTILDFKQRRDFEGLHWKGKSEARRQEDRLSPVSDSGSFSSQMCSLGEVTQPY